MVYIYIYIYIYIQIDISYTPCIYYVYNISCTPASYIYIYDVQFTLEKKSTIHRHVKNMRAPGEKIKIKK